MKIGAALLVGRRQSMRKAGTDRPFGGLYIQINHAWLETHGFGDMCKTTRISAMAIATNEAIVRAWIKALPPDQKCPQHAVDIWRSFRLARAGQNGGRAYTRRRIDETEVMKAWDAARSAARDGAKGQYISQAALQLIAREVFVSALLSFHIDVPERLARRAQSLNGNGHPVSNMEALAR